MQRFATLAILYGWCEAHDHQYLFHFMPPYTVVSADHGHFLPKAFKWTIDDISNPGIPVVDTKVTRGCGVPDHLLCKALESLKRVDNTAIVQAVAIPPDEWGLSMDERNALVNYFVTRRDSFVI